MKHGFQLVRAKAMARKEVRHILRDPFTLGLALGLPVLLVAFFGIAIDFDVRDIVTVVHDSDRSRPSRQFAEVFAASDYFRVQAPTPGGGILRQLDAETAGAVLIITPGFSRDLRAGKEVRAQFVLDGADNARAVAILGYLPGLLASARRRLVTAAASFPFPIEAEPVHLKTRFLYNHELNSRWFTIPGLSVIVLGLLSILFTALTVAREWENGSMELLLSTPVRPLEIIAGKIAPYLALSCCGMLILYLVARLGFGVPFRGSHILFACVALMFLLASLSQGLLISVLTRQQQLAMQLSMMTGLLPSLLLSGFIFPVESMPVFFQYFTALLPPRWFMAACRGIFLKGAGPLELAQPLFALALLDAVLITAAAKRFKRDLEP
ncbi:MAG: ABC transporter permease [Elusimicrobia bacterium]|nr:ABC transporter permease [Elusimicrobiota bacterium]